MHCSTASAWKSERGCQGGCRALFDVLLVTVEQQAAQKEASESNPGAERNRNRVKLIQFKFPYKECIAYRRSPSWPSEDCGHDGKIDTGGMWILRISLHQRTAQDSTWRDMQYPIEGDGEYSARNLPRHSEQDYQTKHRGRRIFPESSERKTVANTIIAIVSKDRTPKRNSPECWESRATYAGLPILCCATRCTHRESLLLRSDFIHPQGSSGRAHWTGERK